MAQTVTYHAMRLAIGSRSLGSTKEAKSYSILMISGMDAFNDGGVKKLC